jgi:hypothetical protein
VCIRAYMSAVPCIYVEGSVNVFGCVVFSFSSFSSFFLVQHGASRCCCKYACIWCTLSFASATTVI